MLTQTRIAVAFMCLGALRTVEALPHEKLRQVLKKYNRRICRLLLGFLFIGLAEDGDVEGQFRTGLFFALGAIFAQDGALRVHAHPAIVSALEDVGENTLLVYLS